MIQIDQNYHAHVIMAHVFHIGICWSTKFGQHIVKLRSATEMLPWHLYIYCACSQPNTNQTYVFFISVDFKKVIKCYWHRITPNETAWLEHLSSNILIYHWNLVGILWKLIHNMEEFPWWRFSPPWVFDPSSSWWITHVYPPPKKHVDVEPKKWKPWNDDFPIPLQFGWYSTGQASPFSRPFFFAVLFCG